MHWFTFHSESDAERKVARSQLGSINSEEEKEKLIWPSKQGDSELSEFVFTYQAKSTAGLTGIRTGLIGSSGRESGGTGKSLLLRIILGAAAYL